MVGRNYSPLHRATWRSEGVAAWAAAPAAAVVPKKEQCSDRIMPSENSAVSSSPTPTNVAGDGGGHNKETAAVSPNGKYDEGSDAKSVSINGGGDRETYLRMGGWLFNA